MLSRFSMSWCYLTN